MSTLNHSLKEAPAEFFDMNRWVVLTILIVHCNVRRRCWPSITRIQKITGKSRPVVIAALKWLAEQGAISLVEASQRIGEEKKVYARQHVYQITGVFEWQGSVYDYLYVPPDNGDLEDGIDGKKSLPLKVKNLDGKKSLPKVYTEDNTSNTNLAGANSPRSRADLDAMFESLMTMFRVLRTDEAARRAKKGIVLKFREAVLTVDPTISPRRFDDFTLDLAATLTNAHKLKDVNKFTSYYGDYILAHPVRALVPDTHKPGDDWYDVAGVRRKIALDGAEWYLDLFSGSWTRVEPIIIQGVNS